MSNVRSNAKPDGFGSLAWVYEGLERLVYGSLLQRARLALLESLAPCKRILILGEGDGRFLLVLLQRHGACEVTVLERSPGMLERARVRLTRHAPATQSRVTFWQADALEASLPEHSYDAIVTHFFLDVFDQKQLQILVTRLTASLEPGGLWLISDFARPQRVEGASYRFGSQVLLPLMYTFFRLTTGLSTRTLIAPQPHLHASGMGLEKTRRFCGGFIYAERWRKG
jgi:tRNA (cmo5U34)-methyltransferase